jgi:heme exporter protein A
MGAMTPQTAETPALSTVSGLELSRGGRLLAQGLDFNLPRGGVLLVLGPNGAGKSSLLLALAGILRPGAGTIHWELRETRAIHLLAHQAALKPRLTLAETLRFWRTMNGPGEMAVETALETVGLGGLGAIEAGHLSAGQGRRLALARLLLSPRPVWLLDEPTAALDADGAALVGRLIDAHAAAGGGAIVATHDAIGLTTAAQNLTLGGAP